jgi:hypothetical protein
MCSQERSIRAHACTVTQPPAATGTLGLADLHGGLSGFVASPTATDAGRVGGGNLAHDHGGIGVALSPEQLVT